MNSRDLIPAQFSAINKSLFSGANYLVRLKNRMEKQGFPHDDPLYVRVVKAYNAMHDLTVHTHYESCAMPSSGWGQKNQPAGK